MAARQPYDDPTSMPGVTVAQLKRELAARDVPFIAAVASDNGADPREALRICGRILDQLEADLPMIAQEFTGGFWQLAADRTRDEMELKPPYDASPVLEQQLRLHVRQHLLQRGMLPSQWLFVRRRSSPEQPR